MPDDFTPPGERSYAEREEKNIEAIQDEEQRKEEARESDFVEVDDEGDINPVPKGGSSSPDNNDNSNNSSTSSTEKKTVGNEIDQVQSRINELEEAKESGSYAAYVPDQLERKKERLNELQGRNPSEEIDTTGNVVYDPEDNEVLGQGDTPEEATARAQLNTGRSVKGFADKGNINEIQEEKKDIVQNRIQRERNRIDRLQNQQERVRQTDTGRFKVTRNGKTKVVQREDLLPQLEQRTTEAYSRKSDFEDFERNIPTNIEIDTTETTTETSTTRERKPVSEMKGVSLVDPDGSETDFNPEQALNDQPETTYVEQGLNTVEEKSQGLVLAADREKDVVAEISKDFGASNVGNDFAALFEGFAGVKPTVQEARDFNTSEPLKSTEELAETGKEEIFDPLATSFTKADEVGLIEPSQDLKERTRSVQSTVASTPLDTAGFLGATSAGLGTISIEQGSRFATRSARTVTGDEDIGRDIDEGEGIERIPVGSAIIADSVSDKPLQFAQEEITQETTEAVVGLGVPTLTVTTTPSNLKTRFEGSVRTAGEKAKETASKTKDAVTDPNALGAGAGAFLPSETATETPSPTEDTVTVDRDALDAFEIDPLQPETIPNSPTQDTPGSIESFYTAASTPTAAEQGPEPMTETQSTPQPDTESRPESLTETLTETPSATQTPSLSQTPSITSSVTRTPSLTDTLTPTPTQTPTNTLSPTNTPTPSPDFSRDENQNPILKEDDEDERDFDFAPDLGSILSGNTITEEQAQEEGLLDDTFSGFESRPEIIDTDRL